MSDNFGDIWDQGLTINERILNEAKLRSDLEPLSDDDVALYLANLWGLSPEHKKASGFFGALVEKLTPGKFLEREYFNNNDFTIALNVAKQLPPDLKRGVKGADGTIEMVGLQYVDWRPWLKRVSELDINEYYTKSASEALVNVEEQYRDSYRQNLALSIKDPKQLDTAVENRMKANDGINPAGAIALGTAGAGPMTGIDVATSPKPSLAPSSPTTTTRPPTTTTAPTTTAPPKDNVPASSSQPPTTTPTATGATTTMPRESASTVPPSTQPPTTQPSTTAPSATTAPTTTGGTSDYEAVGGTSSFDEQAWLNENFGRTIQDLQQLGAAGQSVDYMFESKGLPGAMEEKWDVSQMLQYPVTLQNSGATAKVRELNEMLRLGGYFDIVGQQPGNVNMVDATTKAAWDQMLTDAIRFNMTPAEMLKSRVNNYLSSRSPTGPIVHMDNAALDNVINKISMEILGRNLTADEQGSLGAAIRKWEYEVALGGSFAQENYQIDVQARTEEMLQQNFEFEYMVNSAVGAVDKIQRMVG